MFFQNLILHQLKSLSENEIETLLEEYKKFDLSEYIDLYENMTYSIFKYNYTFI